MSDHSNALNWAFMDGWFYFKSLLFATVAPTMDFVSGGLEMWIAGSFDISYTNKCHGGGVTSDVRSVFMQIVTPPHK